MIIHKHVYSVRFQNVPLQYWGGKKCASRRGGSLIAKDLIDSEDPNHTLFCRETTFVMFYALFQGELFPYFDGSSNVFATFIEQKSYR